MKKANQIGDRIARTKIVSFFIIGVMLLGVFTLMPVNKSSVTVDNNPENISGTDVVISELAAAGSDAYDEFVELYNPTASSIDISGWQLQYASSTGSTWATKATVGSPVSIQSHGFYLLANMGGDADYTTGNGYDVPASGPMADTWWDSTSGLGNSAGKVRMTQSDGTTVVDTVGYGSGTTGCEGNPFVISWSSSYPQWQSAERMALSDSVAGSGTTGMEAGGGHEFFGNGYDTDDNSVNFIQRTTRQPQNSASEIEPPPAPVHNINSGEYFVTIQAAIDDPETLTGHTIIVSAGTYYEHVVVNKSLTIIGAGASSTIINVNGTGNVVDVWASWTNISGFTITNSGAFFNYGIGVGGGSNNNITNNVVSSNYYGIYLWLSSKNNIVNNYVSSNSYGIYLGWSSNNSIVNNNMSSNTYGIWLEYSNTNNITGNNASANYDGIVLASSSTNNSIVNNIVSANTYDGIELDTTSSNNTIVNNNVSANSHNGINLYSSSNSLTYNNVTLNSNHGIYIAGIPEFGFGVANDIKTNYILNNNVLGLHIYRSNSNNITGNNVSSNTGEGIYVEESTGNKITMNNIWYKYFGIHIIKSSFTDIMGNKISSRDAQAIGVLESDNNNIKGNAVSTNNTGITIYDSPNNSVTGNDFSGNSSNYSVGISISLLSGRRPSDNNTAVGNNIYGFIDGIDIGAISGVVDNITIEENNISNNNVGITVYSTNSRIFHNNFINNSIQASNNKENTIWNDTYPSGGNYWSDYTGIDVMYGDLQNQLGSDGIGDTLYPISGMFDGQDIYPLMSPFDYTEYNIPLQQGWNLISLPLRQLNESIDSVLQSIAGKWDCMQTYDASDISDPWKSNITNRPASLNDLNSMNHLKGYWLNVTEPGVTLTVKGDQFGSALYIHLYAGWTLVGYASLVQKPVSEALLGTSYDSIEGFNASDPYRTSELPGSYMMKPGEGYWVHEADDSTWVVNW